MDISLSTITTGMSSFFGRFHVVIFGIVAIGGLAVAVFLLYQIIIEATADVPAETTPVAFDQQTIDALETLRASDNTSAVELPSGRINPFVE